MSIDVIFFDLGDVVCRFQPTVRLRALSDACGTDEHRIHTDLFTSGFDQECEMGRHDEDQILRRVTALGFGGTVRDLRHLWSLAFQPDDAVLELVRRVRATRRTAVLTNNGPLLFAAMSEELPAVAEAFDDQLFSCMFGDRKPDLALFIGALERMCVSAEGAFFIDDSARNVEAARSVGLRACQFVDARSLEPMLAETALLTG